MLERNDLECKKRWTYEFERLAESRGRCRRGITRTGVKLRGAIAPEKDKNTKAFSTCSNVINQVIKEN